MKRSTRIITGLRVSTLAILIIFLCFSCKRKDIDLEVTPLIKPVLSSVKVEKIKVNTATVVLTLTPNGDTRVYYELDNDLDSLPDIYNGTDLIEILIDLSNLERNTQYSLGVRAINPAGEATSNNISFKTYAAKDYNGNLYNSVVIGDQEWLTENLKATNFSNGGIIQNVTDPNEWGSVTVPAYCWYENNESNKVTCGVLYNWNTTKFVFIDGWHVPSVEECKELDSLLGGPIVAGPKLISSLDYWTGLVVPGTNESGFNALPSGMFFLDSISGSFVFSGLREEFASWTASEINKSYAWCAVIRNEFVVAELQQQDKPNGYSIRLIKNK